MASRGEDIIPLIGTKRRDRLAEALKALDLTLSADDLAAVEAAVPAAAVAGDRYAPAQVAALDSERRASPREPRRGMLASSRSRDVPRSARCHPLRRPERDDLQVTHLVSSRASRCTSPTSLTRCGFVRYR